MIMLSLITRIAPQRRSLWLTTPISHKTDMQHRSSHQIREVAYDDVDTGLPKLPRISIARMDGQKPESPTARFLPSRLTGSGPPPRRGSGAALRAIWC